MMASGERANTVEANKASTGAAFVCAKIRFPIRKVTATLKRLKRTLGNRATASLKPTKRMKAATT
jgi:hypothetical protein